MTVYGQNKLDILNESQQCYCLLTGVEITSQTLYGCSDLIKMNNTH